MLRSDDQGKRPTNLSLSAKTLDMAKAMGMNVSQTVDQLLAEEVRRRYKAFWEEQNRPAIEAYNTRVEREGTFGEQVQRWLAERGER
jgi:antitoxin CcdA